MTASPSQLGETTRTARSGISLRLAQGDVRSGERRIALPPPAVHPQPELRVTPDVHLEDIGASLREFEHGIR